MITKNVNVIYGLTNGAMGTVTDIVLDTSTLIVKAILVRFDYESIGQEACSISMYKHQHQDNEELVPFDVSALFTSIPVNQALDVINQLIIQHQTDVDFKYKVGKA